ncbi:MAG: DUF2062 domain-containing protein [Gemmobacter sp.]
MVFKRRDSRPASRVISEFFYPRGGWRRASSYVVHRLRRLPDAPHRIARGVFAGILASFTPLFGFHFLTAAAIAWAIRGNILAALFATFLGNPLTFPLIAGSAMEVGSWLLGTSADLSLREVLDSVGRAFMQLWLNFTALMTGGEMRWDYLQRFFHRVFLPYLIGGIPPGIVAGLIGYYISLPLIEAYQKRQQKKNRERVERRLEERARRLAEAEAADRAAVDPSTAPPPQGPAS